jgi:uncharacterized protein (DUF58 family)
MRYGHGSHDRIRHEICVLLWMLLLLLVLRMLLLLVLLVLLVLVLLLLLLLLAHHIRGAGVGVSERMVLRWHLAHDAGKHGTDVIFRSRGFFLVKFHAQIVDAKSVKSRGASR